MGVVGHALAVAGHDDADRPLEHAAGRGRSGSLVLDDHRVDAALLVAEELRRGASLYRQMGSTGEEDWVSFTTVEGDEIAVWGGPGRVRNDQAAEASPLVAVDASAPTRRSSRLWPLSAALAQASVPA